MLQKRLILSCKMINLESIEGLSIEMRCSLRRVVHHAGVAVNARHQDGQEEGQCDAGEQGDGCGGAEPKLIFCCGNVTATFTRLSLVSALAETFFGNARGLAESFFSSCGSWLAATSVQSQPSLQCKLILNKIF